MCCYLIFSPLSSLPTAFGFYFLFYFMVIIFYYFWFVWCCISELIGQIPELFFSSLSNAETVVTDVALVMGFILFCFFVLFCVADCCAERRILGVFLIFLLSHSSYFINHRSVTQSKKNDSTVYFFHWYLFIGHLYVFFFCLFVFYCVLLFCGGQTGLKVEE